MVYPYKKSNFDVLNFGGLILPEMEKKKKRRPMVKELALLDLPFLSYGQIPVNFSNIFKNGKNLQFSGTDTKTASPIEPIPLP